MLHTRTIGRGPRLVLAHGFTQNGGCWGRFAERLAERFEVVLVDLPGHGRSAHDRADLWRAGDLLADAGGAATYVGYSMGGRISLHAALRHPERVQRLVVIGATAGIDDDDERSARRDADAALADRIEAEGLTSFLDGWLANPLFAGLPEEAACRSERESNRAEGIAASLRACGTGTQDSLWADLAGLAQPMLAIAGSEDAKFVALGRRLVDAVGSATSAPAMLHTVRGTHAVHLERPDDVADVIASWLDQVGTPSPNGEPDQRS